MDPDKAFAEMRNETNDSYDRRQHALGLRTWLRSGGFVPTYEDGQEMTRAQALIECGAVLDECNAEEVTR